MEMEKFTAHKKMMEQITVNCNKCGNQAAVLTQQNLIHPEKENNTIIVCHDCKIAEVVSATDFQQFIKDMQSKVSEAR